MTVDENIALSREYEMRMYLGAMRAMYENAVKQNGEIYDTAFTLTKGFSSITDGAVLEDSRIIKVLRYAVAPSISQMKFGQIFLGIVRKILSFLTAFELEVHWKV